MAASPPPENEKTSSPEPEELKPKSETSTQPADSTTKVDDEGKDKKDKPKLRRRGTYRPSHKATFIALAIVGAIVAINGVVITFVLKHQSNSKSGLNSQSVTISANTLNKLGVNDTPLNDAGIQLTVGPSAKFNNNLTVAGDANISGQLTLDNKVTATDASLNQLEAGNTTLTQLNVNGNGTFSTINSRSGLVVAGPTQFQGTVTADQLFSIDNSLNVSGNLAVGGTLSAGSFETDNLLLSGHVITSGSTPSVSVGSAAGSYGTASISGNDEAGTVAVNAGSGAGSGIVANVTFRTSYSSLPDVIVTSIGYGLVVYVNRSDSGFSIGVGSTTPLSAGNGYAFDYMVEQ